MFNLRMPKNIRCAAEDSKFRVYCKANEESVDLMIVDVIGDDWLGDGITAASAMKFLSEHRDKPINVRINSPGGLAYDGLQIYNALSQHEKPVTATIEGLAFSAASIIAMAADVIRMHEASDIGIHRAGMVVFGNRSVMQDAINWLDVIDEHLVEIYQSRTGASRDQVVDWLDGELDGTLFSAKEAMDAGFADEIIPTKKKANSEIEKSIRSQVRSTNVMNQNRLRLAAIKNA